MKKSTILMLIAICVFTFSGNKKIKVNETVNQNVNKQSNTVINEVINEVVNEAFTNEVNNEETLENEKEITKSTETLEEAPKTAEEKAVDIVRKDWNGKEVQFSVQGMNNNGDYIITVTDVNTTEVLAFYTVNISDGSFSKREIN